jgi:hypothetical protein
VLSPLPLLWLLLLLQSYLSKLRLLLPANGWGIETPAEG